MMRSMYAAVAGLRTHQTRMDVIGDNIANVNTPGFKRGRATFQDIFYQTIRGGAIGSDIRGGTNPQQVGLGISLGTIDVIHTQGQSQPTGKLDDIMIQGDGFFVLREGIDDGAGVGQEYYTRAGAFRFLPHENGNNYLVNPSNGMYVMDAEGNAISIPGNARSFDIDTLGYVHYVDAEGEPFIYPANDEDTAAEPIPIAVAKFPNPAGLDKAGENLYKYSYAAGVEAGGQAGGPDEIRGGRPTEDGRGSIIPGALEMSNVELAQEFTEMIVTQRGFQANARTITVSDEMLNELTNLKR
ncbi:MAG: flagellar hook-basal body complex protein [Bacillota bacterium]